jgi:predicted ester cyclase
VSHNAPGAPDVARRYFDAIARQDLDAAVACWRLGGVDHLAPVGALRVPDEWRAYFEGVFASFPDFRYEVLDMVTQSDRVAVHWRTNGTFTGRPFNGIRATGGRLQVEGLDLVRVEGGVIVHIDSYWDDSAIGRQLGLLPNRGSGQERVLFALFNLRVRLGSTVRWARRS